MPMLIRHKAPAADPCVAPATGLCRLDTPAALAIRTPAQLGDEWQRVHKATAPRISPVLLARGIAWQLQERALGGLAPSAARALKHLAAFSAANAADLRPGTTRMCSWGDRS